MKTQTFWKKYALRATLLCLGVILSQSCAAPGAAFAGVTRDGKTRIEAAGAGFQLSNPFLTMVLAGPAQGYRIRSIIPAFHDHLNMVTPGAGLETIWRLILLDEKGTKGKAVGGGDSESQPQTAAPADNRELEIRLTANNRQATARIESIGDGSIRLTLQWKGVPVAGGAVDVAATFAVNPDCRFVRMRIKVENRSNLHLERIDFPYLTALGPLGNNRQNDRLIWPRTTGILIRDHYENENKEPMQKVYHYPSALQSMQLTGVYGDNGGVYLAACDPDCWLKRFWYTPAGNKRSVDCFLQNLSAHMGQQGNGFDMPYDAVLTVFRNDWWDAAAIYREWALQQPWCPSTTVKENPRFPQSVKNVNVWLKNYNSAIAPARKEAQALQEKLGVDTAALHWYGWNTKPFDTAYPELLPAKSGFREAVRSLQSNGVLAMPYLNARLWDTRVESWGKEGGEKAAILSRDGRVVTERYGNGAFAVMNPSAPLWQDKMAALCREMVEKYAVQALYLDQISAVGAPLDYRGTYSRQTGGGNYWAAGYWRMLDKIHQRLAGKDVFLSSESFTESYLSRLNGGYLPWLAYGQDNIPLAQAVYGGRTLFWGRWFWLGDFHDDAFYGKLADCLTSNTQLGWLTYPLSDEKHSAQMAFARQLAQLYKQGLREAFLAGQFVKPPALHGVDEKITASWDVLKRPVKVTKPAVTTAAWKMPDGALRLLAINASANPHSFTFDLAGWQYAKPKGWSTVVRIEAPDFRAAAIGAATDRLPMSLPGRSASVIILR